MKTMVLVTVLLTAACGGASVSSEGANASPETPAPCVTATSSADAGASLDAAPDALVSWFEPTQGLTWLLCIGAEHCHPDDFAKKYPHGEAECQSEFFDAINARIMWDKDPLAVPASEVEACLSAAVTPACTADLIPVPAACAGLAKVLP